METENEGAGMGALFDLSFQRVITVGIIKIVYILGIVMLVFAWFAIVISAFTQGFGVGLAGLVFATIATFLYLLFLRMGLELVVAIFRIAKNTSIMAGQSDAGAGGPSGAFPVIPTSPANGNIR
jgi:hypothetical protein